MRAFCQTALWIALLLSGRPLAADLPDAEPPRHFLRRPPLSAYTNYGEDLYRPYRREIRLAPALRLPRPLPRRGLLSL